MKVGLSQELCDEDVIQIYKKVTKKSSSHIKPALVSNQAKVWIYFNQKTKVRTLTYYLFKINLLIQS